jgi:alpha-mannosidase
MSDTKTWFVVAHTHWDREWYRSAERFRQRLVALVDELLDDPPAVGESFLLDGQGILLDDYLAVRPERAAELSALLREGRLEAGPWYVLADELIPGGEALVRNLLAGHAALRRLRAEPPPVLYCPDSFGHPAILPDLARAFGCELVVAWRGYGGARWPAGDMVRWRGAAGSEVLLYHLPPDGYEFGSSLPVDAWGARERWSRIATVMAPRAATGTTLLLNGADHHARQRGQREAVAALAVAAAPDVVAASSLRTAAAALVAAAREVELAAVDGELRDSYGYTWTLQGTLATRSAQKRRNARAERTLVCDVEPWIALGQQGGSGAARSLLRAAWLDLLRAHPHDTLCGTSIDAVAKALDHRLGTVEEQAAGLREDALLALVGHDRDEARGDATRWQPAVLLRNPVPRRRCGVAELTLAATVADVAVGPGSAARQGTRRDVPAFAVDGVPLQILAWHERVALTEAPRAYPDADLVIEARALGWVSDIGGYRVETRAQRGTTLSDVPNPVRAEGLALDNGLLRVAVSPDGVVQLRDHQTGRVMDDLLSFEDRRDVGDLYTPALREALEPLGAAAPSLSLTGPLRGEITVRHVSATGSCLLSLQLDADAAFLRVNVRGDNEGGDHRLRLHIATGVAGGTTVADAAFHPVEREAPAVSDSDARMETLVPTAPLHRFVSRYGSSAGVTVFSDGLAEYESFPDGAVAVTLVRAVGELSRHDLPERPGHAGWPASTPAAQCRGPYEARLAIALHGPEDAEQREVVERLAGDVLLPIVGETLRSSLGESRKAGGLVLEGAGLAFSAALPAQRDGWIVLRAVNRRDVAVQGRWRLSQPVAEAARARLDETPLEPLDVEADSIVFEAQPREIVTILARLER